MPRNEGRHLRSLPQRYAPRDERSRAKHGSPKLCRSLTRTWAIVRLLAATHGPGHTIQELVGRYRVSVHTVRRELMALRTAGFPISGTYGQGRKCRWRVEAYLGQQTRLRLSVLLPSGVRQLVLQRMANGPHWHLVEWRGMGPAVQSREQRGQPRHSFTTINTPREHQIRKLAARRGYLVRRSRRRPNADNFGEFRLVDAARQAVVLGPKFEASLDEIEDYLRHEVLHQEVAS